jgi:hypothetical protein
LPAARFSALIVIRAGVFKWRSAIDAIRGAMVAAKSAV